MGAKASIILPRALDGLPDVPPDLLERACVAAEWQFPVRCPPRQWDPLPDGVAFEEGGLAFARRSGRPVRAIYAAILLGFVSGYVRRAPNCDRLQWTVRLSNAEETIDDVMDRLDVFVPPLETVSELRWYSDARYVSGHGDRPVPLHWIDRLASLHPDRDLALFRLNLITVRQSRLKGPVPPKAADGLPDVPPELLKRASEAAQWPLPIRRPPLQWNPLPNGVAFEESVGGIAGRSGRRRGAICAAILLGFVSGYVRHDPRRDRLQWTVRLSSEDETIDDVMERLDGLAPLLKKVSELRWYNDARVVAGHVDRAVPSHWIESVAALHPFHGDLAPEEISGLITCAPEELVRISSMIATMRSGLVRGRPMKPIEGDVRDALRAALDPNVPDLRDTCLDTICGEHHEAPTAREAARLVAIAPQFRSIAIAVTVDAIANAELAVCGTIGPAMERLSIVLERVEAGDLREARRRLRAYIDGRILPRVSGWVRLADVVQLLAAERRTREWIAQDTTSVELKSWLLDNLFDVPRDKGFYAKLDKLRGSLDTKAIARRRHRADVIADNFDGHLVEIGAVTSDAKAIWEQTLAAQAVASNLAEDKFSIELPVRDNGFGDTGDDFLLDLKTVQVRHQLERIDSLAVKRGRDTETFSQAALNGKTRYADGRFLDQRVAVIGRRELAAAIEAHPQLAFLEPYVHGCTVLPRYLPDEMLQSRRDYFAGTGLPAPSDAPTNVVIGESGEIRKLMVWSLALRDEVVLPVTSLYRGMAIANFNYRLHSTGHMRVSTGLQAIDDELRGWTTLGGRSALIAIPKLPHHIRILPRSEKIRHLPVDAETMTAFSEAIAITIHVEGGDHLHPKRVKIARVPPRHRLPPECGDDRYVSQTNGILMSSSNIQYCISFAFGREVLPHDPRHGGATQRYEEGHKLKDIGNAMGTRKVIKRYVTRGDGTSGPKGTETWLRTRDGVAQLGSTTRRR